MSNIVVLSEDDLKELFGLLTSVTEFERNQVYDQRSEHYFRRTDLSEEYTLTQEKREYALDAWRAVCFFLHSRGYSFSKDGQDISLSFSVGQFIA
jgi:hypothetical protein